MAPGIYYMQGGGFTFTGLGNLSAAGVMIVNDPKQNTDNISINGNGTRPQTRDSSSDDDELGATPGAAPPEATETAPVFEVAANAGVRESNVRRGKEVFMADCAGCHGDTGAGDGVDVHP